MNTAGIILEKIISDKAPDHDFIPKKLWIAKCAQMIYAASVSKSSSHLLFSSTHFSRPSIADMILCGSPHSGKSTAAILMIDVLTQMQQQQQLQSLTPQQKSNSIAQDANYAQEIAGQTHKLYR